MVKSKHYIQLEKEYKTLFNFTDKLLLSLIDLDADRLGLPDEIYKLYNKHATEFALLNIRDSKRK